VDTDSGMSQRPRNSSGVQPCSAYAVWHRTAQAWAGDLAFGDLEGGGDTLAQVRQERCLVVRWLQGLGRELSQRPEDEGAAAENALVKCPALTAASELGQQVPAPRAAAQAAAVEIDGCAVVDSGADKKLISAAGAAEGRTELGENEVDVLSRELSLAEKNGVAGPRVGRQGVDRHVETRADGVEVDVADELEQAGVFFDEGVLEAVLEEIAGAAVDAVEGGGVRAEPALSEAGEREVAGAQEGVGMVGHERPGLEAGTGLENEGAEAIEESVAVALGAEDGAALDAASDEVVQSTGAIEPRSTWHWGGTDELQSRSMSSVVINSCGSFLRPPPLRRERWRQPSSAPIGSTARRVGGGMSARRQVVAATSPHARAGHVDMPDDR